MKAAPFLIEELLVTTIEILRGRPDLAAELREDRRARYLVGFLAGLRDGEIAALTWADVDLDAATPLVHVTKSVAIKGPKGFATAGKTKTETSVRTLALHSLAVAALGAWK